MKSLFLFLLIILINACSSGDNNTENAKNNLWVGKWMMTGFDKTPVYHRDTLIIMEMKEDLSFIYITQTRNGNVLNRVDGSYKLNDQKSMISVFENEKLVDEYFIRKIDADSLIFQSDTLSIQWKRVK